MSSADVRGHRDMRRQALVFSVLGLLACILLVAVVQPLGWGAEGAAALELFERARTAGPPLQWAQAPALVSLGLVAGMLAGMLGMAGGVLKVAAMLVIFRMDVLMARAVSLTTMLLATASATRVHIKTGAVLAQLVRPMLVPSVVGVIAGVLTGNILPRVTLSHFFALFALFLAFGTLAQSFVDPHESAFLDPYPTELSARQRLTSRMVGGLHGFMCGLLGISGGVIAIPAQQILLGVPARHAVANTVAISVLCTSFGSVAAVSTGVWRHDLSLGEVLVATVCIGGGAMIGAPLGARLTPIIPTVYLKLLLVQLSLAAGLLILFK